LFDAVVRCGWFSAGILGDDSRQGYL